MSHADILSAAMLDAADLTGGALKVHSPVDGALIGEVGTHSGAEVEAMIATAKAAFGDWKLVPAPRRGELIRLFGEELRNAKDALGALVSLEAGKIFQEGLGEVQEMIDICDLAVGQSRQLFGLTIASERPGHSMRETWHPLGLVGVISAFNFPVAVFAWNFALAAICGNTVIWKPSEKTPLTALVRRCTRGVAACRHRWSRCGRGADRVEGRAADFSDRVDADGADRGAKGCRAVWQERPGTRWQQRDDCCALG